MPPYLAGRETEQDILRKQLACLQAGEPPSGDVVLYGPRGNGKTVLLRWFKDECGQAVDVVSLTPDDLPNVDVLATRLVPPSKFKQLLPDNLVVGAGGSHAVWDLTSAHGSLTELLAARSRQRPLALLLDEAHTLSAEVGKLLLNASQEVRAGAPFLLVMAGTPDLPSRLDQMDATFWDRGDIIGIGRLATDAACDALVRPLTGEKVRIREDALESVVSSSQHYPYFLQLWGEALWEQVKSGSDNVISLEHVKAGEDYFSKRKNTYYARRYREMEENLAFPGLLPVALAVADAFAGRDELNGNQLDTAIRRGSMAANESYKEVITARQVLRQLGYIWQAPEQVTWEPGIPSLMAYVQERTPE